MGFVAVIKNLGKLKANIRFCCDDIQTWKPDVVILIDYAGFNLRIARFAKSIGIRVFYYISQNKCLSIFFSEFVNISRKKWEYYFVLLLRRS